MKFSRIPGFLTGLLGIVSLTAASAPVAWQADLAHCRAEFTVSHMVVSKVWGHVPIRKLTLLNAPGTTVPVRIDVLLDVSHEDTDNHDRDADLRSPTYFDTAQYPTMTFTSTSIATKDAKDFVVDGNLTIKNVTKPVSFPVSLVGVIPARNGRLARGIQRTPADRPPRLGNRRQIAHAGRRAARRLYGRHRADGGGHGRDPGLHPVASD